MVCFIRGVSFIGFHSGELSRLITSTTESFQEIPDETCVIRLLGIRGLQPSMCELFAEKSAPRHDCQLNRTHVEQVLSFLQHCPKLESISLVGIVFKPFLIRPFI